MIKDLKVSKIINIGSNNSNIKYLYNISELNKTEDKETEHTVASLCRDINAGLFFKITDKYKKIYTEDDLEEVMLNYLNNKKIQSK